MTLQETLTELQNFGTEQNRKVYGRHGVSGQMFGVSYANQKKLAKKIKANQALAVQLWESKNHDARILATMIADPKEISSDLLDKWADDLDSYVISDAFAALVAKTDLAQSKMEEWTASDEEWTGDAGWLLLAGIAMNRQDLADDYFIPYLETITNTIHNRKNRVRYAMNSALIAIGMRNEKVEMLALESAEKIGKVHVDHGQTSCKTPDAASYIKKAKARKKK